MLSWQLPLFFSDISGDNGQSGREALSGSLGICPTTGPGVLVQLDDNEWLLILVNEVNYVFLEKSNIFAKTGINKLIDL
jgi:hypothetical protein